MRLETEVALRTGIRVYGASPRASKIRKIFGMDCVACGRRWVPSLILGGDIYVLVEEWVKVEFVTQF